MTSLNPGRSREKGFTLVEILIVVVILGILAAIVVPQFTNASESARASSLTTQLQSIRSQLELYQLQHNGEYPPFADVFDRLNVVTQADHFDGTLGDPGTFGPYLQKAPANPFTTGGNGALVDGALAAINAYNINFGWAYNETTGQILANYPDVTDAAALGLDPADVNTPAAP